MLRVLLSLAGLAAAAYAVLLALVYLFQDRLLYFPQVPGRNLRGSPAVLDLAHEPLRIATADGETLDGWWIPANGARYTLVHFHGNAGNMGDRLELLQILHGLGVNVLFFDYRGYGRSTGAPDEEGTYRDGEAVWSHLVGTRGLDPSRIVLHGQSLGGAIAAWLAARVTPAALILESTFTSAPDIAADAYPWLPVRRLARFRYDTRGLLPRLRCPVLVIHSRDDEIIPFAHGERLYAAAPQPKRMLVIRGDHNGGFWLSRDAYRDGIARFLAEL